MIHTNRIVTVGEQECIIDRPIVLYRGDREVEIEFTLVGNEFMFSEEGNVIKSVNASHGQLVLNTPSGEHMFSELAECHEGKVVFVVTKEMIDEFIEMGFYSFQIRLYDSAEMKSRVTIPPVMNGFDIRNPIAAEDETNVVDLGIVGYARVFKDQSNEELPTFTWDGEYIKTEWAHHDLITENKMNKIEDALYSINTNVIKSDEVMLNTLDQVKKDADKYLKEQMAEVEADVDEFERNLNTDVQQFKINTNAAITAHKNEFSEIADGFDARLADIENVKTIQDLKNMNLKLDTIIQTCGYYEINDGGANTYIVIPSKEYSYDIECNDCAIRPVAISDTVCPKQFGTVNDGVNGDNEWLQACFDFVRDYNIGVIDGRNLLYTTDSSTPTYHDHFGVVIHQPVTLRNYRGQVKDDVGHLTSVIDMLQVQNDFREYLIENCEFNGKFGTVVQSTLGTEDGGRHCICFYGERSKFPKEYTPMGNITIRNCRFIKPDAYGIFMSPADCIYTVENCTFDTNGPCVLSYVTTMIARNCNAVIESSYKTMVNNFLHDEMEMLGNYKGTKLKSIYVDNCHVAGIGNVFKTHNAPQGPMSYDKIIITNSSSASGACLEMYQMYKEQPTTINYVEVTNNIGRVSIIGFTINTAILNNIKNARVIIGSIVDTLIANNFTFAKKSTIRIAEGGTVNNFYLNNAKALETLDPYFDGIGCADSSDGADKIVNLYINDLLVGCSDRIIEIGIENIYCENIHVLPEAGAFDIIYNIHSQGCKKCIVKNSLFEVSSGNYRYFLNNKNASDGTIMFINCVYTTKINNILNGMTRKDINTVNLDTVE